MNFFLPFILGVGAGFVGGYAFTLLWSNPFRRF